MVAHPQTVSVAVGPAIITRTTTTSSNNAFQAPASNPDSIASYFPDNRLPEVVPITGQQQVQPIQRVEPVPIYYHEEVVRHAPSSISRHVVSSNQQSGVMTSWVRLPNGTWVPQTQHYQVNPDGTVAFDSTPAPTPEPPANGTVATTTDETKGMSANTKYAIIFGTLGGVIVLAVLVLMFMTWRKRRMMTKRSTYGTEA